MLAHDARSTPVLRDRRDAGTRQHEDAIPPLRRPQDVKQKQKQKQKQKKARAQAVVAVVTEPRGLLEADDTSMSIACVIVSW